MRLNRWLVICLLILGPSTLVAFPKAAPNTSAEAPAAPTFVYSGDTVKDFSTISYSQP